MIFIPFKYKNHIGRPCKISKDMVNEKGTFTAGHEFIVDYRPSHSDEYKEIVDSYNMTIELKPIKSVVVFGLIDKEGNRLNIYYNQKDCIEWLDVA